MARDDTFDIDYANWGRSCASDSSRPKRKKPVQPVVKKKKRKRRSFRDVIAEQVRATEAALGRCPE